MLTWQEYYADTDPTNPLSVLAITGIDFTDGQLRLDWKGGTGVWQYLLYKTGTLSGADEWVVLQSNRPPTPLTGTYLGSAPATNSAVFYRIKALR